MRSDRICNTRINISTRNRSTTKCEEKERVKGFRIGLPLLLLNWLGLSCVWVLIFFTEQLKLVCSLLLARLETTLHYTATSVSKWNHVHIRWWHFGSLVRVKTLKIWYWICRLRLSGAARRSWQNCHNAIRHMLVWINNMGLICPMLRVKSETHLKIWHENFMTFNREHERLRNLKGCISKIGRASCRERV